MVIVLQPLSRFVCLKNIKSHFMNNDYDYTDPFIDDSELEDATFIDDKNYVKPTNEATNEEVANYLKKD